MDMHSFLGGVEILLVTSHYRNHDISSVLTGHLARMVTLLYRSDTECEL